VTVHPTPPRTSAPAPPFVDSVTPQLGCVEKRKHAEKLMSWAYNKNSEKDTLTFPFWIFPHSNAFKTPFEK